jgi:CRISPR/Cas system CSM-associated protein Csm3 (group 7 of RAMP superfamily)
MSGRYMIAQHVEVARVTIEVTSPLLIGTGAGDDLVDAVCVMDANGLPVLPGSSLAGVLRHAWGEGADDLFGFQRGQGGSRSRLTVSWGQVHGADDRPVAPRARLDGRDEVLTLLRSMVLRDHVRLDGRGVVDERGKFDEQLVPRGARFTFELWLDEGSGEGLMPLIRLLASPALRLGGRTRRGLGAFKVVRVASRAFNLTRDREAFLRLPVSLDQKADVLQAWKPDALQGAGDAGALRCSVQLLPEGTVLFGAGDAPEGASGAVAEADRFPVTERAILWREGRGTVSKPMLVLPASGVKGALRHRVGFWARALGDARLDGDVDGQEAEEVEELFGSIRGRDGRGQAGRVVLDDFLPAEWTLHARQHVSIDRFSGAPMDGLLFGEAPAHLEEPWALSLWVHRPAEVSHRARRALQLAIDDLGAGRLAVGGGASRGHGWFRALGEVRWSDPQWLQGGAR